MWLCLKVVGQYGWSYCLFFMSQAKYIQYVTWILLWTQKCYDGNDVTCYDVYGTWLVMNSLHVYSI